MKEWLVGAAAASVLSALALALCPEGRVKSVLRLVCGIVCALALASPVLRLDVREISAGMAAYGQTARRITENEEEAEKMLERTYIEERCAAYILDKAAALDVPLAGASVLARWDETDRVWYPWEAELDGVYDEALARAIEADLGVPAGSQRWLQP